MTLMSRQETALRSRQEQALAPVEAALRRQAEDRADAIVRQARDRAAATVERARQDADGAVAKAAADGRAQAGLIAAAQLGMSRRAAREQLLGSDLTTYEYLAGRVRDAVLALRSEPGYPALRTRLASLAEDAAGPGAVVTEPPGGGAVATGPDLTVDCSLDRMADRAVAALGQAIAALCEPAEAGS
jgi:vacuolar-type H+-ATPase subunit E/Vma4